MIMMWTRMYSRSVIFGKRKPRPLRKKRADHEHHHYHHSKTFNLWAMVIGIGSIALIFLIAGIVLTVLGSKEGGKAFFFVIGGITIVLSAILVVVMVVRFRLMKKQIAKHARVIALKAAEEGLDGVEKTDHDHKTQEHKHRKEENDERHRHHSERKHQEHHESKRKHHDPLEVQRHDWDEVANEWERDDIEQDTLSARNTDGNQTGMQVAIRKNVNVITDTEAAGDAVVKEGNVAQGNGEVAAKNQINLSQSVDEGVVDEDKNKDEVFTNQEGRS